MTPTRCIATTRQGKPCRAWAVQSTDPPRCASHLAVAPRAHRRAARAPVEASAPTIATASIDGAIVALLDTMARMEDLMLADDITNEERIKLFGLHSQCTSRMGRLLRDRRALSGDAADGITGAIAQALDELSTELGTEL